MVLVNRTRSRDWARLMMPIFLYFTEDSVLFLNQGLISQKSQYLNGPKSILKNKNSKNREAGSNTQTIHFISLADSFIVKF